ncbi:MAG: PepSY domain-containing protein [Acidobacteriia bacterium]|nr:PepSY domain-containing protein [Terriglobia bacterium]
MASRIEIRLKRFAVFIHRWMGVAFCLLFAWWFATGVFMMYWDYPDVSAADRLARAPALDGSLVRLLPQEALVRLQAERLPIEAQLAAFDGRPVYRFEFGGGEERMVYADDGEEAAEFSPDLLLRAAATWTGRPAHDARFEGVLTSEDQWTVSGEFRPLRPLWKYSWPDGEEVYVSEVTGEVAQYTTRASRLGAYFGAIPHWLYFTPLRKNGKLWSRIVIGLSAVATAVALFGVIVGVWMYVPSGRVPYTGQKRLHMILGLFFGIIAGTWAFSGMLSMDPFPTAVRSAEPDPGFKIERALRGRMPPLEAFAAKPPREALAASHLRVKQLDLRSFDGKPVYLATESPDRSMIVPVAGAPVAAFPENRIQAIATETIRPDRMEQSRLLTEYDAYYRDRRRQSPLPVLLIQVDDPEHSRYYIDPRTARIVGGYSSSSWVTRWLYHGLHSIDLPWLYLHRPAWDLVVLALLAGGCALSVTSVVIAGQLLRRKLRRR